MNVSDKTAFLKTLQYILKDSKRIRYVSDRAFEAVDISNAGYLEKEEIEAIMRNVTSDLSLQKPKASEINTLMEHIDLDKDKRVCKKDFVSLIQQVLIKMKEHEEANLINT